MAAAGLREIATFPTVAGPHILQNTGEDLVIWKKDLGGNKIVQFSSVKSLSCVRLIVTP